MCQSKCGNFRAQSYGPVAPLEVIIQQGITLYGSQKGVMPFHAAKLPLQVARGEMGWKLDGEVGMLRLEGGGISGSSSSTILLIQVLIHLLRPTGTCVSKMAEEAL